MKLFARLLRAIRDRHDPAWAPTGVRVTQPGRYDEAKAVAGYRRSQAHTSTGRKLPKPRKVTADVRPFERKRA